MAAIPILDPAQASTLQLRLTERRYAPGPIDGIAGRRTLEALFCYAAKRPLGDLGRELALSAEIEFPKYGIVSPLRIAHLLAQIVNETGGFRAFSENLNYSAEALLMKFGRHRISAHDARKLGRAKGGWPLDLGQQRALANVLYGGPWGLKNLGNVEAGDGWRYRGRGALHLTGRANYRAAAARLGYPFEADPDLAARPALALVTALDFWSRANVNAAADRDDVVRARKITNGGTIGLDEVADLLARCKAVLL